MPVIGVHKTVFDSLSVTRKRVLRYGFRRVGLFLNHPVEYESAGGRRWWVACDTRISLEDAAVMGRVAALVGQIPNSWMLPADTDALKRKIRGFVKASLVWPVVIPEGQDRWKVVLAANGAPAALRFADGVPESWKPVGVI